LYAEEAAHAVPLPVPVPAPVGRTLDDPVPLGGRQLAPRGVARDAGLTRVAHQVVLALGPGGRLQRLDRAVAQRLARIGDHQAEVDADHAPETTAGVAGPERGIEAEQRRLRIGVAAVALRAVQTGGPAPGRRVVTGMDVEPAAAALQREFDGLHHARPPGSGEAESVGDDVEDLLRALDALALHAREAARREPLRLLLGRRVGRQLDRKGQHEPRVPRGGRSPGQVREDRLRRVMAHRQRRLLVEQLGRPREQQLQVVVQLGHRADRAAAGAHRVGLVDGDGRRHAVDTVDRRAVHAVEELPCIGAEGLDVAALPLGIQRVEDQAGLARSAGAGDDRQLAGADVQVQVLQVVLAGAADADDTG